MEVFETGFRPDGETYTYVVDQVLVAEDSLASTLGKLDELGVSTAEEFGGHGTWRVVTLIGADRTVPELLAEFDPSLQVIPHHVLTLSNHTQFGPYDAPGHVAANDAARQDLERAFRHADGSGPEVVIIDSGLLPPGMRATLPGAALGYTDPAAPPAGGRVAPTSGHGTFVAGRVLRFCPSAKLHIFRPSELKVSQVEAELSDVGLARCLTRALTQLAGMGGPGPADDLVAVATEAAGAIPVGRIAVLNLSLAGPAHQTGVDPLPITRQVLEIWSDTLEVPIVAAAGNQHRDDPHFPAAYSFVCGVGATDPSGAAAPFSNYGPWVSAWEDGMDTVSTFVSGGAGWNYRIPHRSSRPRSRGPWDGYAKWSGTSFAAPAKAGKIACGQYTCDGDSE